MGIDRFGRDKSDVTSPARDGDIVTPGAAALPHVSRALWIGSGGDVVVNFAGYGDDPGEQNVTIKNVPDGYPLPIQVTHVLAGTTAADIVALY